MRGVLAKAFGVCILGSASLSNKSQYLFLTVFLHLLQNKEREVALQVLHPYIIEVSVYHQVWCFSLRAAEAYHTSARRPTYDIRIIKCPNITSTTSNCIRRSQHRGCKGSHPTAGLSHIPDSPSTPFRCQKLSESTCAWRNHMYIYI